MNITKGIVLPVYCSISISNNRKNLLYDIHTHKRGGGGCWVEWVVGGGGDAKCVCVLGGGGGGWCVLGDGGGVRVRGWGVRVRGWGGGGVLGDGGGHRIPRLIWYRSMASYFDRLPLPWASGNPDPVATQCDWSLDPSVHWNATGEWIVRPSSVS